LQLAFDIAEKYGVIPLLDVEDITSMPKPDKLSIMTYLSQYTDFFYKYSIDRYLGIIMFLTKSLSNPYGQTNLQNQSLFNSLLQQLLKLQIRES
jgi:hypothetical protein